MNIKHQPQKRFGQNFLQDESIIDAILRVFQPQHDDNIIEIGPGLGALTQRLLKQTEQMTAIEIDAQLHASLMDLASSHGKTLRLIPQDVLTVDFSQFGHRQRVIGNLPYNISTPLLFHVFNYNHLIHDMLFMLQKEVVERLAATPGTKAYGRLSVMAQYHCKINHLFNVPATAFYPQPKVESAIVALTPRSPSLLTELEYTMLERIVKQSFAMRRKTLENNLKGHISANDIRQIGLDPRLRPEQISLNDYLKLAQFICK